MKPLLIALLLIAGCATSDPARYIERHCPIQRVYGDELDEAVRDRGKWKLGDKVKVGGDGYCTFNSMGIKDWAEAVGMPCKIVSEQRGNHWAVHPLGSRYCVDYVDYLGIKRTRYAD